MILAAEDCDNDVAPRHDAPVYLPTTSLPKTDISFATDSLTPARVLGQIDRKFIACVLPATSNGANPPSLVIVDQHAADERVLLEDVLSELCNGFIRNNVETFDLAKSRRIVLLNREETDSLRKDGILRMFERWGVSLDLPDTTGDYAQILVKTVPMALAARLNSKESTELTRLIRLYLDVLDDTSDELTAFIEELPERSEGAKGEIDWMRALRWMPKEILELAKSKACRSESDR